MDQKERQTGWPDRRREKSSDVYVAISSPSRREILDHLLAKGTLTQSELEQHLGLSRAAIIKHGNILESAGLVSIERLGIHKRYSVNTVPLQLIYDNWIKNFLEAQKQRSIDDRSEPSRKNDTGSAVRSYVFFVKSTPEVIWQQLIGDQRTKLWLHLDMTTSSTPKEDGPIVFKMGAAQVATGKIADFRPSQKLSYELNMSDGDLVDHDPVIKIEWRMRRIRDYATKLFLDLEFGQPVSDTGKMFLNGWPEAGSKLKTLCETGSRFWISMLDA